MVSICKRCGFELADPTGMYCEVCDIDPHFPTAPSPPVPAGISVSQLVTDSGFTDMTYVNSYEVPRVDL